MDRTSPDKSDEGAYCRADVPHYYFNAHDNCDFVEDDVGLPFPDLEACKVEAARGLAELARDVVPGSSRRELSIEVQNHQREPLLQLRLSFEILVLANDVASGQREPRQSGA